MLQGLSGIYKTVLNISSDNFCFHITSCDGNNIYVWNMIIDDVFVLKVFLWLHKYLHLFLPQFGGEFLEQLSWHLFER